jgi:hypothetical protein
MLIAAEVTRRVFVSIGKLEEAAASKDDLSNEEMNLSANNVRLALA